MQKRKLITGIWLSVFSLTSFSSMVLAAPAPITTLSPAAASCSPGSGVDYQVGPGKQYTSIGQVPMEDLEAGDTLRIFWRAESYKEKLMISAQGTASQPVVVCGVPGPSGQLPVIDGQNATTRPQLEFPFNGDGTNGGHQPRGLVTIGHAHDDQDYSTEPTYVTIQGLEIRNAAQPNTFTDRAGDVRPFAQNAAGIFIQRGKNITIRGNIITNNGNGVFGGTGGGEELMENILFEGNYIHANGNPNSDREHNVYLDGSNITYQFNRFGPPKSGSLQGANIKDRSAGVTVRYNWIEDGARLLDLVHAQEAASSTVSMPSYNTTEVYGNVFVRTQHTGTMIHYGGDDPGATEDYRKGTLKFYNNTFIVNNANVQAYSSPSLFEISTNDEKLDARNNIFYLSTVPGENKEVYLLGRRDNVTAGVATFKDNWFSNGWTAHQPQ
ncbi:MAG: right-handed parallel beta-helix repeat-containing protein, partial [Candidatus Altimarinota bacterium]